MTAYIKTVGYIIKLYTIYITTKHDMEYFCESKL